MLDTVVRCASYGERSAPLSIVHVHANERTALEAALRLLRRGRPIVVHTLVHAPERLISIRAGRRQLRFDPNRIFSPAGAAATLRANSSRVTDGDAAAVAAFGDALAERFEVRRRPLVIAAHNNTQKGSLTIRHFLSGGSLAREAARAHQGVLDDPDDFFFVTDERLWGALVAMDRHVVLQSPGIADDGSLSVRCAREGVPYVNVECEHEGASPRRDQLATNQLLLLDALLAASHLAASDSV